MEADMAVSMTHRSKDDVCEMYGMFHIQSKEFKHVIRSKKCIANMIKREITLISTILFLIERLMLWFLQEPWIFFWHFYDQVMINIDIKSYDQCYVQNPVYMHH